MVDWRGRWANFVWAILGFLMFLGGLFSENIVTMVVRGSLAFAGISIFLTSYVKSESMLKRASEVVSGFASLGTIVYGYILTGSLVLGIMASFIASMFFVAFTLSYLLPKLRSESETSQKMANNSK
ncbi:hypothetical protein KEJ18_07385 [Candidatus Bathyarchaeota archaeon]|nr:hypothetical protein [Candidatus Bathyarchaeota archaeon]